MTQVHEAECLGACTQSSACESAELRHNVFWRKCGNSSIAVMCELDAWTSSAATEKTCCICRRVAGCQTNLAASSGHLFVMKPHFMAFGLKPP